MKIEDVYKKEINDLMIGRGCTKFHITGIRHCDFKDKADDFIRDAAQKMQNVILMPEEANQYDQASVVCRSGNRKIGYVSVYDLEKYQILTGKEDSDHLTGHFFFGNTGDHLLDLSVAGIVTLDDIRDYRKEVDRQKKEQYSSWKHDAIKRFLVHGRHQEDAKACIIQMKEFVIGLYGGYGSTTQEELSPKLEQYKESSQYDISLEGQRDRWDILRYLDYLYDRWHQPGTIVDEDFEDILTDISSQIGGELGRNVSYTAYIERLTELVTKELPSSETAQYYLRTLPSEAFEDIRQQVENFPHHLYHLFHTNPQEFVRTLYYARIPRKYLDPFLSGIALVVAFNNYTKTSDATVTSVSRQSMVCEKHESQPTGIVDYWLHMKKSKGIKALFDGYYELCLREYEKSHECDDDAWGRDLKKEFVCKYHISNEKKCIKESEALLSSLSDSIQKKAQNVIANYLKYVRAKRKELYPIHHPANRIIEDTFFDAYRMGGPAYECMNWIRTEYKLPYIDFRGGYKGKDCLVGKWKEHHEIIIPEYVAEEYEDFDDGVLMYSNGGLMEEIHENLKACLTQDDRIRYIITLLQPFKEFADAFCPKARIDEHEKKIKDIEKSIKYWEGVPEDAVDGRTGEPVQPKKQIAACISVIEGYKKDIAYWGKVQDDFFWFAQHGLGAGNYRVYPQEVNDEMCKFLGDWWRCMIHFARRLAALALTYGIKLMDVQEKCEVYLIWHFSLTDYIDNKNISSIEHARRLLEEIEAKKSNKKDKIVMGGLIRYESDEIREEYARRMNNSLREYNKMACDILKRNVPAEIEGLIEYIEKGEWMLHFDKKIVKEFDYTYINDNGVERKIHGPWDYETYCEVFEKPSCRKQIEEMLKKEPYKKQDVLIEEYEIQCLHSALKTELAQAQKVDAIKKRARDRVTDDTPKRKLRTTKFKTESIKKIPTDKPKTLKYFKHGDNGFLRMQTICVHLVYKKWCEWKWINHNTSYNASFDDFKSFFEGDPKHCNIEWTGPNTTILTILLQELLKQPYIEKQTGISAKSLVTEQFKARSNYDRNRLDKVADERIRITLFILNPENMQLLKHDAYEEVEEENISSYDLTDAEIKEYISSGGVRVSKSV